MEYYGCQYVLYPISMKRLFVFFFHFFFFFFFFSPLRFAFVFFSIFHAMNMDWSMVTARVLRSFFFLFIFPFNFFFRSCFYSIQLTLHFFISTPPWLLIRYAFILLADCLLLMSLFQRYFTACFFSTLTFCTHVLLDGIGDLPFVLERREDIFLSRQPSFRNHVIRQATFLSHFCSIEEKKKKVIDTLSFKFTLTPLALSPSKF